MMRSGWHRVGGGFLLQVGGFKDGVELAQVGGVGRWAVSGGANKSHKRPKNWNLEIERYTRPASVNSFWSLVSGTPPRDLT